MYDYYEEMEREMEKQRDEEILDEELKYERKIGIQSIDAELNTLYGDLSLHELEKLRYKKIRELDNELADKYRKRKIKMQYDRDIERRNGKRRDRWFEDDYYRY